MTAKSAQKKITNCTVPLLKGECNGPRDDIGVLLPFWFDEKLIAGSCNSQMPPGTAVRVTLAAHKT